MRNLFIRALVFILIDLSCIGQSPVLHHAVPSAVAPGKTTTLTFFGEKLNGATELWMSFLRDPDGHHLGLMQERLGTAEA